MQKMNVIAKIHCYF